MGICPSPQCMYAAASSGAPASAAVGGCSRNTDCGANAWCEQTSFDSWCASHGALGACPSPQCVHAAAPAAPAPAAATPAENASAAVATVAPSEEAPAPAVATSAEHASACVPVWNCSG